MKKNSLIFLTLMVSCFSLLAQVKIGTNPASISPGSLLELESTSKALTLPRMTTVQMESIQSPIKGMIVFNIDSNCIYLFKSNNAWASIAPSKPWPYHSNDKIVDTAGNGKGIISLTGRGLEASGIYSHAEGLNSIASGPYSWATGNSDTATGNAAIAMGSQNKATGEHSVALGFMNIAAFQSAIAIGQNNRDSGWASIAGGLNNVIEKDNQYNTTFGFNNISTKNRSLLFTSPGAGTFSAGIKNINSGYASVALGALCRPSNVYSLAANFSNLSNSSAMSAFGHYNDTIPAFQGESYVPSEILFAIGNGNANSNRRNSLTMLRNGFTTINTIGEPGANVPRAELDIKGTGAMIVPVGTTAQRPETPVVGMIRLCTDCGNSGSSVLQGYNGSEWVNL